MPPFGATEGENRGCPELLSSSLIRDKGPKAGVSGTGFNRPPRSLPRERKTRGARVRDGVSGTTDPGLELSLSDVLIVSPSLLRLGAATVGMMKEGEAGAENACPVPDVESDMRGRWQLAAAAGLAADESLATPL